MARKGSEPRIAVFCRCGAQWFGRFIASAESNIDTHRERCGEPVPIQTYELLGHKVIWPGHWTDDERADVRSAQLAACTNGKVDQMRKLLAAIVVVGVCAACDIRLDTNGAPTSPTAPGPTNITNTNTNTSTNNNDRSDTTPTPSPPSTPGDGTSALPLPTYGEGVVRSVADRNPGLVANSCQDTAGDPAWGFLDLVVRTLRAQDQRWGYLCKDAACLTFGRDVITYRATSADTGIWIVDVIGNHCPGPNDSPATVRYGVLPFETVRRWSATRKAGVF